MSKADGFPALSLKLPALLRSLRMLSTTFDEVENWLFMGKWPRAKTAPLVYNSGVHV
jgi:hypothetical protein